MDRGARSTLAIGWHLAVSSEQKVHDDEDLDSIAVKEDVSLSPWHLALM